ncbi:Maltose/maltodextrin import ATP-binding protein MalK [Nocardiopsis dassonvillei]|uniref:ABC transporter related protein n=2 Tax=Nocardiopsis dassonvillei TaxID=2014 RepID=D7B488_NOCDD|nr:ABC transporter related protein [Nocardiopsis dassonvillei subsp. dassonvillei DSM 43111]VEI89393.1 Maltose/maltodextrin import ATP-binding protein MalK [Nocardiopsis dassonvillei]
MTPMPRARQAERTDMRSETSSASLTITDLRKDFGGTAAVDGVSIEVPAGSFLVLLGPSGCGKTTTLRMLAGLENPTGGEIRFGDRVIARGDGTEIVPPAEREAGLVFQSYALWPHKTVRQNIVWPLTVAKWSKADRRARSEQVLSMLSIEDLADRYPGEISGGQQQRVAIARMIAPQPKVLLFDEPLSNLDAKLRVDTRGELMRVHRSTGATSVYVTHDQVEAMTMATHIALMKDGRIEQFGTPRELLESPRTAFAATFVGTPPANIIECRAGGGRLSALGADCGAAPASVPDGIVRAMYRAGSLGIDRDASAPGSLEAVFADQVPMADRWVVGVDLADGTRVNISRDTPVDLRPGDAAGLRLPEAPDAYFDAAGDRLDTGEAR